MSALGLADAKAYLNIDEPTWDNEIQAFADAAEAAVAQRVGPLSTSSVTSRVPGYSANLYLPVFPVVSLTSVTPTGGTALTLGDLYLDTESGQVSYSAGGSFGSASYDVVYTAGRATVPADLLAAVKDVLRGLWSSQRGAAARPTAPDENGTAALLSPRALGLIEPYERRQRTLGA